MPLEHRPGRTDRGGFVPAKPDPAPYRHVPDRSRTDILRAGLQPLEHDRRQRAHCRLLGDPPGLTHTVYAAAGWTGLLYFASQGKIGGESLWFAGGLSYSIHLLADALTNRGIRPLPPFKWRIKLKIMSTGSKWGRTVENACIVLTLVLVWYVFMTSS